MPLMTGQQQGTISNPTGFPAGRQGQCRARAEQTRGVSDQREQVFALQKLAETETAKSVRPIVSKRVDLFLKL
jgi:hypothetical protein